MAAQFDTSKLEIFQLHPMDNCGTARGTISADGHAMTVSPWWDNDGSTGEVCRCTCGFVSRQFSGNGAWQAGHDGPPQEHKFDETHAALREAVSVWESAQPWLLSESLMSQNTPSWEELLERLRGVKDPGLSTNSDFE